MHVEGPIVSAIRPVAVYSPLAIQLLLAVFCGSSCLAQSATNFNTAKTARETRVATKEKASAEIAAKEATAPVSSTPSRYVGEADLEAHVASLSAVFSMKNRTTDPFGQLQDPDAKPIVKASVAKTPRRAAPVQATPFSEIIRLLKVTTIMPGEKRFLVGTRSIKQGETIPFVFRGKHLRVEIASVSSRQIEFRNLETGDTASLQLNLLPVGMSPGTGGISAPGMIPDSPNSPIELESMDNLVNENLQNP